VQLVGDDVFVTNPEILKKGIADKVGNALLVKLNQIGTVTETLDAVRMAADANYATIIVLGQACLPSRVGVASGITIGLSVGLGAACAWLLGVLADNASLVAALHGTTVLAFKFSEGVIVAGDRLATEGYRVASRDVQKVYATDAHSMIAIAGAAGPAIEMARLMRIELEHYEKIEGEALELDGKANKLSQMVRANLPAAMQGLVVVPLFAGYDLRGVGDVVNVEEAVP